MKFTTNISIKAVLFILINFIMIHASFCQENDNEIIEEQPSFWHNVRFGGGIGLGFGNGFTTLGVSPSAIYIFNESFASGLGLNVNYSRSKDDFSATVFGGSVIGLYKPIEEIIVSSEFELSNVHFKDELIDESTTYWYPALFLGAGYNISNFGAVGIRYDVLYNADKSIYGTAWIPFIRYYF